MTDTTLLEKVKSRLQITGAFHDEMLQGYIDDTKAFMRSAGVSEAVLNSEVSVGCIMRGVADLWNYGAGSANFSHFFRMRLLQLRVETVETTNVEKLAPYLYKTDCEELDYTAAAKYFERYKPTILGNCSAVRNGNFFGRNYDWTYDKRASFIVHTPAANGRHAVLGVSTVPSDLTQEFVDSGKPSESYNIVPFMLMDGINDAGLICEINVVPAGDKGLTTGTNKQGEDLFAMMIPRFVLDYAANVDEAIQLLENRNIYCADNGGYKEEFHFMIADKTKTVVVEFIDNEMNVIDEFIDDKPIITNLYLTDYDGTRESLTPYAMGIERQALLTAGFNAANSELGMLNLMTSVLYTKSYSADMSPLWYSEFCGGDLTKDSTPEEYAPVIQEARALYEARERDGKTWQTVHTSIYNIAERKLTVIPQETGEMFTVKLSEV